MSITDRAVNELIAFFAVSLSLNLPARQIAQAALQPIEEEELSTFDEIGACGTAGQQFFYAFVDTSAHAYRKAVVNIGRALGAPFTALLELPVRELAEYSEIAREMCTKTTGQTIIAAGGD